MTTDINMNKKLKIWLWVSVLLAVSGALMLYPIGIPSANVIFVIVKICMVTGLLIMLFAKKIGGYCLWATASLVAVIMTIIKCSVTGHVTFLFIGSMFVDIFMPIMAYKFMDRPKKNS
jgi:hypothetical protein